MRNKILLVYSKFPIQEGPKFNVPLGVLHLGTYLKSKGVNVRLIDCNIEDDYLRIIAEEAKDYLCVGISTMTAQVPDALKIARTVRKLAHETPIVFGGVHATLFPEQVAKSEFADYVIIGEGELPFFDLIKALQAGMEPHDIEGIAYTDKAGEVVIRPQKRQFDFSQMPKIDYSLLSIDVLSQFEENYVSVLTSRGCPHRCAFCINTVIRENRRWRAWPVSRIFEEIESIMSYGAKKAYFWDENFFLSQARVVDFVNEVKERNLEIEWFANIRCDYFNDTRVSRDFLKELERAGCRRLGLGAESGSNRVLNLIDKDITTDNIIRSAHFLSSVNIRPTYSFMIGIPGETREDVKKTVNTIKVILETNPKSRILGPQLFRPYPVSKLYEACRRSGWKAPDSIEEWDELVRTELVEADVALCPWIKHKGFASIVWFYSLLLSLSPARLIGLFWEYCSTYKKSWLFKTAGTVGVLLLQALGKLRYQLGFSALFIEPVIFKKYRSVISC